MIYKTPRITVDGIVTKDRHILLIQRKNQPFKNKWALPGGFVEYNETTEGAVAREVFEETGLKTELVRLAGVYSNPERDPRGHIVSIVYFLKIIGGKLHSGDDASDVKFFDLRNLPALSFDHDQIINDAFKED